MRFAVTAAVIPAFGVRDPAQRHDPAHQVGVDAARRPGVRGGPGPPASTSTSAAGAVEATSTATVPATRLARPGGASSGDVGRQPSGPLPLQHRDRRAGRARQTESPAPRGTAVESAPGRVRRAAGHHG